jgi:DNA-binding CsgD family transcriptional regulator
MLDVDSDTELGTAIRDARSVAQTGAACRRVSETLGFRYFQLGFRIPISLTQPCQIILSGYPKAWRTRYDDCGYLTSDPVVMKALGTVMAFGWDELELKTPAEHKLFEEAAAHGLRHGFSAPAHGAHGEGALFSFAREEPLPARGPERESLFHRAQWFAAQVHERLRGLVQAGVLLSGETAKRLTPRERTCLQFAAEGLSAPIIGRDMRISEHTVNFHLNNAEIKLGARSRRHAVARAVALGEIQPSCYAPQLRQSQEMVDVRIF